MLNHQEIHQRLEAAMPERITKQYVAQLRADCKRLLADREELLAEIRAAKDAHRKTLADVERLQSENAALRRERDAAVEFINQKIIEINSGAPHSARGLLKDIRDFLTPNSQDAGESEA